MAITEEYKQSHGFVPEKIADVMEAFYAKIDALCAQIEAQLSAKGLALQCKPGCCHCCQDGLSMTQCETAVVRKLFPKIGEQEPHAPGACPFLDAQGLCRIYAARPYICRTHGLPMRTLLEADEARAMGFEVEDAEATVEMRDICSRNEALDVMALEPSEFWPQDVAQAQLATMEWCTFGGEKRVPMRDFFKN